MSCSYIFDGERKILVLSRQGRVSGQEIVDNFCAAADQDEFQTIERILVDHAHSDFGDLSSENIITIARLYREKLEGRKARVAVVSPGSEKYGLSRMFEQYSGLDEVRVFKTEEEALAWLE